MKIDFWVPGHGTERNVDMPVVPRIGETVHFRGTNYRVDSVRYDLHSPTIQITTRTM